MACPAPYKLLTLFFISSIFIFLFFLFIILFYFIFKLYIWNKKTKQNKLLTLEDKSVGSQWSDCLQDHINQGTV